MSSFPVLQELSVQGRRPSLPSGLRIYAVGDIHGRLDLLSQLLSQIDADVAARPTARPLYVFLGDYIDRGSWSRETIDRLIEHRETKESVFLKGNHELIAIKCLSDRGLFEQWMRLGGLETLCHTAWRPKPSQTGSKSPNCSQPSTALCRKRIFVSFAIYKILSCAAISSLSMPG
jgi:hypothetical protein